MVMSNWAQRIKHTASRAIEVARAGRDAFEPIAYEDFVSMAEVPAIKSELEWLKKETAHRSEFEVPRTKALRREMDRVQKLAAEVMKNFPLPIKPLIIFTNEGFFSVSSLTGGEFLRSFQQIYRDRRGCYPRWGINVNLLESRNLSDDTIRFAIAHECGELARRAYSRYEAVFGYRDKTETTGFFSYVLEDLNQSLMQWNIFWLIRNENTGFVASFIVYHLITAYTIMAAIQTKTAITEYAISHDRRRYELACDDFGAKMVGPEVAVNALLELYNRSADNDWLGTDIRERFEYFGTHPSYRARIERQLKKMENENGAART